MKVKDFAKLLVCLSENSEGKIDAQRVEAVLEHIQTRVPEAQRIGLLREFRRRMQARLEADSAVAEFAGELDGSSKEAIERFVYSKNPRSNLVFRENPDLIAGVKISVGGTVFENSLKMKLEGLAKSLGA